MDFLLPIFVLLFFNFSCSSTNPLSVDPPYQYVPIGGNITIVCSTTNPDVIGRNDISKNLSFKTDQAIVSNFNDSAIQLTISNATVDHEGTYKCDQKWPKYTIDSTVEVFTSKSLPLTAITSSLAAISQPLTVSISSLAAINLLSYRYFKIC